MKTKESVTVTQKDGTATAYLRGEIDHHRAVFVRCELDDYIRHYRPSELRIDASEVHFMDSSGLGLLMGRLALMQKMGGKLILCDPSDVVLRMVRLAGMERLIDIEKSKK